MNETTSAGKELLGKESFDKDALQRVMHAVQKILGQATLAPEMQQVFTRAADLWRAEHQALEARLREVVETFDTLVEGDATVTLDKAAESLTEAERYVGAYGQAVSDSIATLAQSLAQLEEQRDQRQALVEKARDLTPADMQAERQKLEQALENVNTPAFRQAQDRLLHLYEESRALHEAKRQAEEAHEARRQALAALDEEEEVLRHREESARMALAQWEEREQLRALRQACLDTARDIQALRAALQQRVP